MVFSTMPTLRHGTQGEKGKRRERGDMARRLRIEVGDVVYHVLDRRVGRTTLFDKEEDYAVFERVLSEAHARLEMRLLAYYLTPNLYVRSLQSPREVLCTPGDHSRLPSGDDWRILARQWRGMCLACHEVPGDDGVA